MEVVPKGRVSLDRLLYEQAKRDPGALLRPGVPLKFNNERLRMFVEGEGGGRKLGLHLHQSRPAGVDAPAASHWLHASSFTYVVDHERQELRLRLFDACFQATKPDGGIEVVRAAEIEPYLIPFDQLFRQKAKASAMTLNELRAYLAATPDAPAKAKVEIERRWAFSLACLVFALVGVPLGMQARRRESSGGLLTSLGLAGGYFLFMMLAGETKNTTHASLLLWLPNGLCLILGLWLFRRARHK
jgi:lipopolysaccharide export system permease protein